MFRSLRSRLLMTHMLVSALVLIIVAVSLVAFLINSRQLDQLTTARLQGTAELVAEHGPRVLQFLGTDRLNSVFRNLGVANARGLIVGRDGEILADTRAGAEAPPLEVIGEVTSTDGATQGSYGGFLNRWLYVSQPLQQGRSLLLLAPRPSPVGAR